MAAMIATNAAIASEVRDAVAAFSSSLEQRYGLRLAGIYVLARGTSEKLGAIGGVDVTVIFDGDIEADDKMTIGDLADAASEQTGVQVCQWPVSAFEWSHPEAYCNPSLIANTKRSGVPVELVVAGEADRSARGPAPNRRRGRATGRSGGERNDGKRSIGRPTPPPSVR